jgi:hypothetical protein
MPLLNFFLDMHMSSKHFYFEFCMKRICSVNIARHAKPNLGGFCILWCIPRAFVIQIISNISLCTTKSLVALSCGHDCKMVNRIGGCLPNRTAVHQ